MNKLVLVILAATACGGLAPKEEDNLLDSIRKYNEDMRWSRYDVAATHIPPELRSQFVDDWDQRAKDLRITEYDLVRVDKKGPRAAKAQIRMEWYKDSEGKVHETSSVQTWERHGKLWYVVDESRLRGTEMPGLPEPLMTDGTGPAARR